jgi:hypothetical protein
VCGTNRWVLIDWDGAGPGSRLWDLAYAAHGFVPLQPGIPVAAAAARLTALADGYRLDENGRQQLAGLLVSRIASMYGLLREGHGLGCSRGPGCGKTDTATCGWPMLTTPNGTSTRPVKR